MIYDKKLDRIVLFGGQNCTPTSCTLADNSTWFFDPRQQADFRWQQCLCLGDKPTARTSEALAYHFDGEYALLFGGASSGVKRSDTWELQGIAVNDAHWVLQTPVTVPSARSAAELGFLNTTDPSKHQMIMFGGNINPSGSVTDETWQWLGTNWQPLSPGTKPSARFGHRMEYDDSLGELVVFGAGEPVQKNDVWFWDGGGSWSQCGTICANPPTPRCCMGLAYDQTRGTLVVYAGSSQPSPAAFPDTWLWDQTVGWRCAHNCGV